MNQHEKTIKMLDHYQTVFYPKMNDVSVHFNNWNEPLETATIQLDYIGPVSDGLEQPIPFCFELSKEDWQTDRPEGMCNDIFSKARRYRDECRKECMTPQDRWNERRKKEFKPKAGKPPVLEVDREKVIKATEQLSALNDSMKSDEDNLQILTSDYIHEDEESLIRGLLQFFKIYAKKENWKKIRHRLENKNGMFQHFDPSNIVHGWVFAEEAIAKIEKFYMEQSKEQLLQQGVQFDPTETDVWNKQATVRQSERLDPTQLSQKEQMNIMFESSLRSNELLEDMLEVFKVVAKNTERII